MGNCLKTQLKESVANDSLMKLGEFRVKNKNNVTTTLGFKGTGSITISIIGSGSIKDFNGNPLTTPYTKMLSTVDNSLIKMTPGTEISVDKKYGLTYFYCDGQANVDLDTLFSGSKITQCNINGATNVALSSFSKLPGNITIFYLSSCTGVDITDFDKIPSTIVNFTYANLATAPAIDTTELSNLAIANLSNLKRLAINGNINCTGSIVSLAAFIKLLELNIENTVIIGSVEEMLDAMAQNRTSGTLELHLNNLVTNKHTKVTFTGTGRGWEDVV